MRTTEQTLPRNIYSTFSCTWRGEIKGDMRHEHRSASSCSGPTGSSTSRYFLQKDCDIYPFLELCSYLIFTQGTALFLEWRTNVFLLFKAAILFYIVMPKLYEKINSAYFHKIRVIISVLA
jgi:hypothetical protein